jgi:ferredoxin
LLEKDVTEGDNGEKRCLLHPQFSLLAHRSESDFLSPAVNLGKTEYVNGSDCTRCGLSLDICDNEALVYGVKYLDKII